LAWSKTTHGGEFMTAQFCEDTQVGGSIPDGGRTTRGCAGRIDAGEALHLGREVCRDLAELVRHGVGRVVRVREPTRLAGAGKRTGRRMFAARDDSQKP
jgi:hypothetical protein